MSITITEKAAQHIKNFLYKKQNNIGIRVGVKKTGCSGFSYIIESVSSPNYNDFIFESLGIKIFIDANDLSYFNGAELDYVKEGFSEGLKFNNPNEKASCGCGESFMF
ncbi:Iron-binding protein IscA [Candidatus Kinetoplastibacterium sorsogonicusi]|uniref:Iron-binding protein IscA n=1 Tax=Candidatus Kinetoplastidibacterium kentomonadis TaxID=1576550 RepID=A0A3Q8F3E1_9PROT|nr:iron-sulfur cluster assembly accessory protein [Candidatus Kinetoplastibacterium sorsogonicusi]AWD32362.1 Iron-binding protein IscA [Candidatus Kinetoplastibacterium sorsogonicusi]